MSDKQTTAVVLLVILALVFYLYSHGTLGTVVQTITGSSANSLSPTASSTAAGIASNYEVAQGGVSYANGTNTAYTLNSIYGINATSGILDFQQPSGSGSSTSGSDLASLAGTVASLGTLFG